MCGKADKKNAQAVSKAMVDLLLGAKALSVTPDRGKEYVFFNSYLLFVA